MDGDSHSRNWNTDLFHLKSTLSRLKLDRKQESLRDLEKCIDKLYDKLCTSRAVPVGDGVDWTSLNGLCEAVRQNDVSPQLISKTFSFFQLLAETDCDMAHYLVHCCGVLSLILVQLDSSTSCGCAVESIALLMAITSCVAVDPSVGGAEQIFVLLLTRIKTEKEMGVLRRCLNCISNLASSSSAGFQAMLGTKKDLVKEVHSRLIQLLSKKNPGANLPTLRVLANLSLNTSMGEVIFSAQNIQSTFDMVFNVFYRQSTDASAVASAVDLLVDMLKCQRIRKAFVAYKHLKVCVQSTLVLLVLLPGETVVKLCKLFHCLLRIGDMRQMVVNLFFVRVCDVLINAPPEVLARMDASSSPPQNSLVVTILQSMLNQEPVESPAARLEANQLLQLLRDIFEGATACGLLHSVLVLTKQACPLLRGHLQGGPSPSSSSSASSQPQDRVSLHRCLTNIEPSLDIALALTSLETAPPEVAEYLSAELLSSAWRQVGRTPDTLWWAAAVSQDARTSLNSRSVAELKLSLSLKLLDLLNLLSSASGPHRELLNALLLTDAATSALVGRGLLSEDSGSVARAVRVIQYTGRLEEDRSSHLRDGVMAACGEYTAEVRRRSGTPRHPPPGRSTGTDQTRPISTSASSSSSSDHHHRRPNQVQSSPPSSSPCVVSERPSFPAGSSGGFGSGRAASEAKTASLPPPPQIDPEAVEKLIRMLKTGMEVKDIRSSEIMMVYECKLQNMKTKEAHLQELLEAKTNALFHADRLNSQCRSKMTQFEAECMKLRHLLQDAEKRNEKSAEEMCSVRSAYEQSDRDKASLTKKVAYLTEELGKMKSVVVECEALKRELSHLRTKFEELQKNKLKADHRAQAGAKKIEALEGHQQLLLAEKDRLQNEVRRGEEEGLQLTKHMALQEKQFQELKGGIAAFERQVQEMEALRQESLQKNKELLLQLKHTQEEQRQLIGEVNSLQEANQRLDTCVEEQKKEIDSLFGKNELLNRKLQHIQSILH